MGTAGRELDKNGRERLALKEEGWQYWKWTCGGKEHNCHYITEGEEGSPVVLVHGKSILVSCLFQQLETVGQLSVPIQASCIKTVCSTAHFPSQRYLLCHQPFSVTVLLL